MKNTEEFKDKNIKLISMHDEMSSSYLSYAMSVIVSRALPDVRDGLKPVHRRILYAMYKGGYDWSKQFRKSARIVGDVIGKYHPHGDQSVYDALVRMVQDFSMSLPLIQGQGNFGSIDGDPAAAMRYTETRLSKVSQYLIDDIEKNTITFKSNYDETEKEPSVLPAQFPNLLVNGAGGIAVGMATSIPPHNLGEIIDGTLALIDNKDIKILEAILFASGEPLDENDLKEKIKDTNNISKLLLEIKDFYKNRGINLIKTGNKWSFRTAEDLSDELTIFKTQKRKLSRAALETLSIIAYQQPITRSEIENIRGVQMGRGSLDHLMEIGWIRPSGRKSIPGKPTLWSTTDLFVEHFGLNSLSDLPNKEELKASGFLDKRAAIATISDLAKNDENLQSNDNLEQDDENNIDDFIQNT